MERIEELAKLFQPVFEEYGVILYELKWYGGKEKTLQAAIMREDGSMDIDTCADVSEALSALLDEKDPIPQEYTLEVCSPGAEREIKNLDELDHMTGQYVFVRLKTPFKKMTEFTGEIQEYNDGVFTLEYRDKAAKRKMQFTKEDIEFIRMAVRI